MSSHRSGAPIAPVSAVALLLAAGTAVRRFLKAIVNRGAVNRLCELDERQLKDIGLTRSDVVGALAEPFYRDPSRCLAERAGGAPAVASRRSVPARSGSGRGPSAAVRPASA